MATVLPSWRRGAPIAWCPKTIPALPALSTRDACATQTGVLPLSCSSI